MGVSETESREACLRCERSVERALLYCQDCAREYVRQAVGIEPLINLLISKAEEWAKHLSLWSKQLHLDELQLQQGYESWLRQTEFVVESRAVKILQSKAIEAPLDFLISNGFTASKANRRISQQPGIYVVLLHHAPGDQGECLYVGKALNLCSRVASHKWLKR